jgi:hypothetical protein
MLITWSILEHSIGYVNAEETNSANDGLKTVDQKECNKNDHSSICKDLQPKIFVVSASSSNDTNIIPDKTEFDKKHTEPFILPFP